MLQTGKRKFELVRIVDGAFRFLGPVVTAFGLIVLAILVWGVVQEGAHRLGWDFMTSFPSRKPEEAGIFSAWVGTIWIMVTTAVISVPVGIGAGIYLEEYARKNKLTDFIEINIANLAGVPSVIYGILGLGIFVRMMHLGRSVLAGAMTLSLLILPIVILATREALKAVPFSIREASYGLGATRWQTVRHQVLPAAAGSVMTGVILALSRAIGETAPLITLGALTYIPFLPTPPVVVNQQAPFIHFSLQGFLDPFTVLPIQIFNWVSRPQKGFAVDAAAGIIVLLIITLIMNGIAIYFRYKKQQKVS